MDSTPKDAVLQRIREAARTFPQEKKLAKADAADRGRLIPRDMTRHDLVELFAERAESSGAQVHVVKSPEALEKTIGRIVPPKAAIAVSFTPEFEEALGAGPEDLLPEGCRIIETAGDTTGNIAGEAGDEDKEGLFTAAAAVTDADLAVAETGSIVIFARANQARLVSLVAEKHIALVRPDQIFPDLLDWAEKTAAEESAVLPNGMTMITGPSKTADIEIKLVVGVHGPAELHLIVLDY
jgi:L-lactate dehydrogenase complex protein LldG